MGNKLYDMAKEQFLQGWVTDAEKEHEDLLEYSTPNYPQQSGRITVDQAEFDDGSITLRMADNKISIMREVVLQINENDT